MTTSDQLRALGLTEKQEELLAELEETEHILRAEARMEPPRRIGTLNARGLPDDAPVFDPGGDDQGNQEE